jgi:hypothetical protein
VDGDLLLPGAAGRSALDARIRVSLPRDGPSPDQR